MGIALAERIGVGTTVNRGRCKILFHPGIVFRQRLYIDFNLSLKHIKLKKPTLETTMQSMGIGIEQCSVDVVEALECLMALKRAKRMHSLKKMNAFPSSAGILQVGMLFGDFVSDTDMARRVERRVCAADKQTFTSPMSEASHSEE